MKHFTDLVLAIHHLTEELKARKDLQSLPPADLAHLCGDIRRVYERLVPAWVHYMEYLKKNYPYLFSLAMRTNPYDEKSIGHHCLVIHRDFSIPERTVL